jgi:hypothetical protein
MATEAITVLDYEKNRRFALIRGYPHGSLSPSFFYCPLADLEGMGLPIPEPAELPDFGREALLRQHTEASTRLTGHPFVGFPPQLMAGGWHRLSKVIGAPSFFISQPKGIQ